MGKGDFELSEEDIKVFLDEAEEQLQVMEAGFLALEKEGTDPEQLQAIFRAAHTLKGSSATLGHRKMAEVTHALENVLDKLRKGKLTVTPDLTDTLFACLDVLGAYRDEIATGQDSGVDPGEILERLAAVDGGTGQEGAETGETHSSGTSARFSVPPLEAAEEARVQEGTAMGLQALACRIQFDREAPMPSVRAYQALLVLADHGEVVRSWPSQQEVEADQVSDHLDVLLLTGSSSEEIRQSLAEVPEITVAWIGPVERLEPVVPGKSDPGMGPEGRAAPELSGEKVPAGNGGGGRNGHYGRTVRVDVELLDNLMNLVGELVIDRTRLYQVLSRLEADRSGEETTQVMSSALAHISRMTAALQDEIQRARMLPLENLFRKFPRMVRDLARKLDKDVQLIIQGEETELDRSVIEEISDPLMHLLRNAVDHGIEPPEERVRKGKPRTGTIRLEAAHEENHIIIVIEDDGRGIDPERVRASAVRKGLLSEEAARRMPDAEVVNLIWSPGFSTAEKVSDISGRGVGLDVVQKNIEKLNGSVEIRSQVDKGTLFRVKLPLTLAIIRALQVSLEGTVYCIPLNSVVEIDSIPVSAIQTMRQREVIVKRGEVIPLFRLADVFGIERPEGYQEPEELYVVIVSVMGRQAGIVVDDLIGEGDVVIKPLGKFIGDVPGIAGATIMGDGDVAIILDVPGLVESLQADRAPGETAWVS